MARLVITECIHHFFKSGVVFLHADSRVMQEMVGKEIFMLYDQVADEQKVGKLQRL